MYRQPQEDCGNFLSRVNGFLNQSEVDMIGTRGKKDGADDNNANDENEASEIRGKKKKANRVAPVRVAWYFCIIHRLRRWFATQKEAQLLYWHDEGRKEHKKDGKFRHPADAMQ
jgi:hypothetical protein